MRLTTALNNLNRSSCRRIFVGVGSFSAVFGSVILILLLPLIAAGQRASLTDDAQVSSNTPNQNFGSKTTVQVSGTNLRGFFKFKLTPNLPDGTTGGQIEKATLKMYVGAINTPGSLELHRVDGVWDEGSITNNSAPPIGVLVSTVMVDATQQDRWVVIDVTSMVKDWLDGAQPNNGIALVAAPSGINVTFNSKENQATSHEPILEISLNHVAEADHALTADNAATATIASTANALSGSASINGNQVNGDLTNATIAGNRVIGTVANSTTAATANALSGVLPIANGGTGSSTQNFVDLSTNQTIAGSKTFSSAVNTSTQYNIGGFRILHNTGTSNLFAGVAAGNVNTGSNNAFFGFNAGSANTTGSLNAFFGQGAGQSNTTGQNNAYFGSGAGINGTTGVRNSFFGSLAGVFNTAGGFDSFFGATSGFNNTTGVRNAFFGNQSGLNNTSGNSNVFIGDIAGINNTTGTGNTFVGQNAGSSNTNENQNTFVGAGANGAPAISNSAAIGANSQVMTSNTMVLGTNAITVQVPGNLNVSGSFTGSVPAGSSNYIQNTTTQQASSNFSISGDGTAGGTLSASVINSAAQYNIGGQRILHNTGGNLSAGIAAGESNTTGGGNAFFGSNAGRANTSGSGNAFFGAVAGQSNTTASNNAFFGFAAGGANTTGILNAFFGQNAGVSNTSGNNNAFFGGGVGQANTTGFFNSFFGSLVGLSNTTGVGNSFFGGGSASNNTTGSGNSFFGVQAGSNNTSGSGNTFVGQAAGGSNTIENNNTFIGAQANGAPGITNATAIGVNAQVTTSDTMVLGTGAVTVQVPGNLSVTNSFSANGSNLTNLNASNIASGTLDNGRLGIVPISNGGTGSATQNFVDLFSDQNISGTKTFAGNVGIGTTSPNYNLDVAAGTINASTFRSSEGSSLFVRSGRTNVTAQAGTSTSVSLLGGDAFSGGFNFNASGANLTVQGAAVFGGGFGAMNGGSISLTAGNGTIGQPGAASGGNIVLTAGNSQNLPGGNIFLTPGNGSQEGNVGIGTVSPAFKLDVAGPGNFSGTLRTGSHLNVGGNLFVQNSFPQVNLETSTGQNLATFNATTGPGSTAAIGSVPGTSFVIRSGGLDSIFIDPNNQRVGVGTTNPSEKLDVAGGVRIENNVPGAMPLNMFKADTGERIFAMWSNPGLQWIAGLEPTGPDTVFRIRRNGGANAISVNNSNNFIGLGISSTPNFPLDVAGNANFANDLYAQGNVGIGTTTPGNLLHLSSSAGAPGIQIDNTGSAKSFSILNVAGSNPRLSLNDVSAGTERLVIDSSGNVGIGTVAPTQKLEVAGNLRINGDFVATGAKSAVVTLADKREVALYAVESTGNWFEDFGSGKLNNGGVEIQLDSLFAQTVNTNVDYHVFLTPNGNCNGLYLARKTATSFEVRELGQGTSTISFDYRIVARRRGYENVVSGKR